MSITKIEQLRKERKSKVEAIKSKIESIKNNEMYAPEYKMQQEATLRKELEELRQNYDSQITELITNAKNEAERSLYNAEFNGLEKGTETRVLLQEMRAQEEAEILVKRYKDMHEALYSESEKLVNANLPQAQAYIKAMKKLGVTGAETLERQYKDQNLNDLQKAIKSDLNVIERVEKEYEIEKEEDLDPFKAALMGKMYFGN